MIQARRAPVRPRVICPASGEALLLEDEIRALLDAGAKGAILLLGEPGAGKTTALAHLAAALPEHKDLALLDECDAAASAHVQHTTLAICAAQGAYDKAARADYWLAPWGDDDLIEYLLSVHKDHCAAVMGRLRPTDHAMCGGLAELWHVVLDTLASDPTIADARHALRQAMAALLEAPELHAARVACFPLLMDLEKSAEHPALPQFPQRARQLLRHKPVQLLLAADLVADDLRCAGRGRYLENRLPRELVQAIGAAIAGESDCHSCLLHLIDRGPWNHPMAASVLHASGYAWRPAAGQTYVLCDAYLDRVDWPDVALPETDLSGADFSGANLSEANLRGARANKIALAGARLTGAVLDNITAAEANLAGADLSETRAEGACFSLSNLKKANLAGADLTRASFSGANLTGASFRDAELEKVDLTDAEIVDADFTGAFLEGAKLSGLRLREAVWTDASFGAAQMVGCDLEGLTLPGVCFEDANLQDALLTGCVMPGANFDHACLKGAGLGDVEWEGVSLRAADLRGATFHMGSTRSGLVGTPSTGIPPASEGTRTGFYTDDYAEQHFKAPEEIRKANLCRADLRGALIDDVDFYLVDLRSARYDPEHEQHLRRCGAILADPVDD